MNAFSNNRPLLMQFEERRRKKLAGRLNEIFTYMDCKSISANRSFSITDVIDRQRRT